MRASHRLVPAARIGRRAGGSQGPAGVRTPALPTACRAQVARFDSAAAGAPPGGARDRDCSPGDPSARRPGHAGGPGTESTTCWPDPREHLLRVRAQRRCDVRRVPAVPRHVAFASSIARRLFASAAFSAAGVGVGAEGSIPSVVARSAAAGSRAAPLDPRGRPARTVARLAAIALSLHSSARHVAARGRLSPARATVHTSPTGRTTSPPMKLP